MKNTDNSDKEKAYAKYKKMKRKAQTTELLIKKNSKLIKNNDVALELIGSYQFEETSTPREGTTKELIKLIKKLKEKNKKEIEERKENGTL